MLVLGLALVLVLKPVPFVVECGERCGLHLGKVGGLGRVVDKVEHERPVEARRAVPGVGRRQQRLVQALVLQPTPPLIARHGEQYGLYLALALGGVPDDLPVVVDPRLLVAELEAERRATVRHDVHRRARLALERKTYRNKQQEEQEEDSSTRRSRRLSGGGGPGIEGARAMRMKGIRLMPSTAQPGCACGTPTTSRKVGR